ncbi:MAG: sialate O-acetylesterase [Roseibacillus sp.]
MKLLLLACSISLVPVQGQTLELFFLAGQSNADGSNSYYFDNGDSSKGGGLSPANASYADAYSGIQYAYAHANPFSGTPNRYLTGSLGDLRPATWGMMGPEISLGRKLDELHSNDVALLKYTSPGTSLATQWGPDDGLLYQDMISFFNEQITILSPSYTDINFNTFFWHQGESDSGLTYQADFQAMFDQLRLDLSSELTGVTGLISENFDPGNTGNTPRLNITQVNEALENLGDAQTYLTTTGSLTDIPLHDNIHFDADGQLIHGERMASAYESEFLAVPEPGSIVLLLLSGILLPRRRARHSF